MKEVALYVRAAIYAAVFAFAGGVYVGMHHAATVARAKEADRLEADAQAREAEWARGQEASRDLQTELLLQQITNDSLRKAFDDFKRRNPIVVARVPVAVAPGASSGTGLQPAPRQPVPGGNGLALTLGAVWMWNSALAGRDVPAGSCGLADTSAGSCAAPTDLTVEDAWDNHAVNAFICADIRTRYRRLIDFVNQHQGAAVPAQH